MIYSLRRRLLVIVLSAVVFAWVVASVSIFYSAQNKVHKVLDAHLAQTAETLLSLVKVEFGENHPAGHTKIIADKLSRLQELEEDLTEPKHDKRLVFQISVSRDRLRFFSAQAPDELLSGNKSGLAESIADGKAWRVFTLHDRQNSITVHVAEPRRVRHRLVKRIAFDLVFPVLIGLPILWLALWTGIGRGLAPLQRLADQISRRDQSHLYSMSLSKVPAEAKPLVTALNKLFVRLEDALEREKRFTADAAHELRTPLAGLKTQAQVALRTTDENVRGTALLQLVRGVDRSSHLIDQLLTLARFYADDVARELSEISMGHLLRDVLSDIAPLAHERNIDIILQHKIDTNTRGHSDALAAMLRNIVDNAIRYSPIGGTVELSVDESNGYVVVQVDDNGPGIPITERENAFGRFCRLGRNEAPGSGLGLSIAQRIADMHGIVLGLDTSPARGLRVNIRFPRSGEAR